MEKYRVKLLEIIEEGEGTKTFYFEKPKELTWEEGSHIHLGLEGFDEGEKPDKSLVRHMSISTLPIEGKIGITTRVPGSHSVFKEKLNTLKLGDEVKLFKCGSRMSLKRKDEPVILISMGVGMATMRPLIKEYLKNQEGVPSLLNITIDSINPFIFQKEFSPLETLDYQNHWISEREVFTQEIQRSAKLSNGIYYIVGTDNFLRDTVKLLRDRQVSLERIVLDKKEEARKELLYGL